MQLVQAIQEDYNPIAWAIDAKDDEVVALHLLGICPE